jgi:hypothetical protein
MLRNLRILWLHLPPPSAFVPQAARIATELNQTIFWKHLELAKCRDEIGISKSKPTTAEFLFPAQ